MKPPCKVIYQERTPVYLLTMVENYTLRGRVTAVKYALIAKMLSTKKWGEYRLSDKSLRLFNASPKALTICELLR